MAGLPGINDPRRLDYITMWELIKTNRYLGLPQPYSDELLISMFWEESTFCNIRQVYNNGSFGPAVGFGQAQVYAEGSAGVLWRFSDYYSSPDQLGNLILGDPGFSITFTGMLLANMHSILNNKEATLLGYSGQQGNKKSQWLASENELLAYQGDTFTTPGGYVIPLREELETALTKAKPDGQGYYDQILQDVPYEYE
jgi:hypothetical protein